MLNIKINMRLHSRTICTTCLLVLNLVSLYAQYTPEKYPIIPKPMDMQTLSGFFAIDKYTKITFADDNGRVSARVLQKTFQDVYSLSLRKSPTRGEGMNEIFFNVKQGQEDESYSLEVSERRIRITASNANGAFYAIQTLMQLYNGALVNSSGTTGARIPAVRISDRPALAYRGLLLDVARYFMPIPTI